MDHVRCEAILFHDLTHEWRAGFASIVERTVKVGEIAVLPTGFRVPKDVECFHYFAINERPGSDQYRLFILKSTRAIVNEDAVGRVTGKRTVFEGLDPRC